MYAEWSPTIVQLRNLLLSLTNNSDIQLYIYDIDNSNSISFFDQNGLHSEGWGETFWIKNGRLIAELKNYTSKDLHNLKRRNNLLQ